MTRNDKRDEAACVFLDNLMVCYSCFNRTLNMLLSIIEFCLAGGMGA
jgi:hypothetical protein